MVSPRGCCSIDIVIYIDHRQPRELSNLVTPGLADFARAARRRHQGKPSLSALSTFRVFSSACRQAVVLLSWQLPGSAALPAVQSGRLEHQRVGHGLICSPVWGC